MPLLLVVAIAAACGGDATPTPQTPPTATSPVPTAAATIAPIAKVKMEEPIIVAAKYGEKPRYGGKFLNTIKHNITHFDIQQAAGSTYEAQTQLYNSLIMTNPYDWRELRSDLAHSWDASPDSKKWIFHLQEGVKWHDGAPFSSADVKYTFDRILNNGKILGNQEEGTFQNVMWNAIIESVEAPDPNTVVINLKGPSTTVLKLVSSLYASIIPKHLSEKDPLNALKNDKQPIGTGPFRMTEPASTVLFKYERNPEYFKPGLPFLDELESHLIYDLQTRLTAVLTERLHWSDNSSGPHIPASLADSIASQDSGIIQLSEPTLYNFFFTLNTKRPPFDDIRVRQAFSEALDRNLFLYEGEGLGEIRGVLGTITYPLGKWALPKEEREKLVGHGPDMDKRRARARELLADYEAENGKIDWSKVVYQIPTQHTGENVGQIIKGEMAKVGVDLTLKPMETITAWENTISRDYNMAAFFSVTDFDDPTAYFSTQYVSGAIWGFHDNFFPEMDALYQKQLFLADFEERKQIAWEMDKFLTENSGMIVLAWHNSEHIRRDYVMGWYMDPGWISTNARMETIWLDRDELPFSR
jgi:peptide/nickel transport system substrate-binding protein